MEDTFLGKEGYVQLIREISRVLCQKAGWSEVSTLCPHKVPSLIERPFISATAARKLISATDSRFPQWKFT